VVWRVALVGMVVATVLYRPIPPTQVDGRVVVDSAMLTQDRNIILFTAARILLNCMAITAVLSLRTVVRAAVARSIVPLRSPPPPRPKAGRRLTFADYGLPASAVAGLAPRAAEPQAADDGFWAEVERLRATSGADLPMLESHGLGIPRWHLLSSGAAVNAARTSVTPGAALVVYRRAPQTVDGRVVGQTAGTMRAMWRTHPDAVFVGLIEETGTLTLRLDRLSTEEDLASWLGVARTGVRCAAYLVNEPDAWYAMVGE
jgi:hypothetical protein